MACQNNEFVHSSYWFQECAVDIQPQQNQQNQNVQILQNNHIPEGNARIAEEVPVGPSHTFVYGYPQQLNDYRNTTPTTITITTDIITNPINPKLLLPSLPSLALADDSKIISQQPTPIATTLTTEDEKPKNATPKAKRKKRKQAETATVSIKPPTKKKQVNPQLWKNVIRKTERAKGNAYVGAAGIPREGRPMLPSPCTDKSHHENCNSISEENRKKLYDQYRALANIDDQRQYINKHIENRHKNRSRSKEKAATSRRQFTVEYYFTVERKKIRVCRLFFLATLNITDALIRSTTAKTNENGFLSKDQRGRHTPHNKISESDEEFLRNHITSFRAIESLYWRKKTGKQYLDSSLNVKKMYGMYVEECEKNSLKPAGICKYRQVFKSYNLGFLKPKKDDYSSP